MDPLAQAQELIQELEAQIKILRRDYDHHTHDGVNSQLVGGAGSLRVQKIVTGGSAYALATSYDMLIISAQNAALAIGNPVGSSFEGQKLLVRIKDDATPRALTFGTEYRSTTAALPTTTTASKWLYMGFFRNVIDTKWDLVATVVQV